MPIKLRAVMWDDAQFLYELLKERTPDICISHQRMPTFDEHVAFVKSSPYKYWFIIWDDELKEMGSIYLTRQDEIGLFLKKEHQGKGYGKRVLHLLLNWPDAPTTFLVNINPKNKRSIEFFKKVGFKHIQNTYRMTKK